MKYLVSDFYCLVACSQKGVATSTVTVSEAYRRMNTYFPHIVSVSCLLSALKSLSSGGFLKVVAVASPDGSMTPDTPLALTAAGKEATALPAMANLFGKDKALRKKAQAFCRLDRPSVETHPNWALAPESIVLLENEILRTHPSGPALFDWKSCDDGSMAFTIRSEGGSSEERNLTIVGHPDHIRRAVSDLLDTALLMTKEPFRARKILIHGYEQSVIVTFTYTAGDESGEPAYRMTVDPIAFNRARFVGKRDGQLEYAQCAASLLVREFSPHSSLIPQFILPLAWAMPGELTEEMAEQAHNLYTWIYP